MNLTAVVVYRPLDTISPQIARVPRTLPDAGRLPYSLSNTVLDPRILRLGGYVDITGISPDGIRPFVEDTSSSLSLRVFSRIHVPRHIALGGIRKENGTSLLSPLQSAFNELVKVLHDPDPGVTKAQRQRMAEQMLSNLLMIAADEFRRTVLRETVRFRVPGALKVAVVDDRLGEGEIGLSQKSIARLFGAKQGSRRVALVGRYPTFSYLAARVTILHDVGDAVAVSPAWLKTGELGDIRVRTYLDLLEGDTDGDLLSVIPAPNAECAEEILSGMREWETVPHSEMKTALPPLSTLQKDAGNHLQAAIGKCAVKEYVPLIISALYRSWIVLNLCEKHGVDAGLQRIDITCFWKAISEGVFDLKHDARGVSAAEDILLAFSGSKDYSDIVPLLQSIEKMPENGPDIGRRIWEVPRILGAATGRSIPPGDLPEAACLCRTWRTLEGISVDTSDPASRLRLAEAVQEVISEFDDASLGQQLLCDVYGLHRESEVM